MRGHYLTRGVGDGQPGVDVHAYADNDYLESQTTDGNGEGEIFLGADTVTTDVNGDVSFEFTLPAGTPNGYTVTATATDPTGNTSEFSTCVLSDYTSTAEELNWHHIYDPLDRLTEARNGDAYQYTYDAVGNRLTQTHALVTNTYTYEDANRLTDVDGQAITWDANDNILSDGTSTNTYNSANQLTTVTQGASAYSYAYNGLGDRLGQTVDAAATNYTLDLNAGLTQVLADGTDTYLYGLGRVAQQTGPY